MTARNEKCYFQDSPGTDVRAMIYDILAFLYNQLPSLEFIDKVKAKVSLLRQCPLQSSRTAKVWRQVFLKKMERLESSLGALERQENVLELAIERTRLIRGASPDGGPPPPYESVYRGEGIVMGESTRQVIGLYQKAEYSLPEGWRDMPDYIGIELDFMAYLCRQEADAWQRGDAGLARAKQRQQREFLANHLAQWVPGFYEQVSSRISNGFLMDVLEATRCFLELEMSEFASNEAPERASGRELA